MKIADILIELNLQQDRFYHGTSTAKPRSTSGLYVTNHQGWAQVYAKTAVEQYGGKPIVLTGHIRATNPKMVNDDEIEQLGYDDAHIVSLSQQGYDCAMRDDGQEVFLFSYRDFIPMEV